MAVKINALPVRLLFILLSVYCIEVKLICRHKGSTYPQDKAGDIDPCAGQAAGYQKETSKDTKDYGNYKRESKLPYKSQVI